MMWKKNWAIPVCIVPMFVASAVCAIGVTVVYDSLPLPIVGQKLVWAMVYPCLSYANALKQQELAKAEMIRARSN